MPDILVGISYPPVCYVIWFRMAVFSPHRPVFRLFRRIDVFIPVQKLLRRARGRVDGQNRIGARQFAEMEEFIRSEIVPPHGIGRIGDGMKPWRTLLADAVFPMVMIRAATAGPSHRADSQFFASIDDILAQTVDVRNGAILAHPDAVINDMPEIFEKHGMDMP